MAKICSDQAKPNGVLWVMPGREAAFLAPLDVRSIPGVGKVSEKNLHSLGIRKVGDLAKLDEAFLEQRFGKLGLALAGKAQGLDAGGWFDTEIGAEEGPKSISHEHTFSEDTADLAQIEATLANLSEMVGRRLREHGLSARTIQLKLRYSDFSTITRAHSVERARPHSIPSCSRRSARCSTATGRRAPECGCWACTRPAGRKSRRNWTCSRTLATSAGSALLAAADHMRDRFGESAVSLAASLRGKFRERAHENPAGLPGKKK